MVKVCCDICKENDANISFKIKKSRKGMWIRRSGGNFFDKNCWQPYEKIVICDKCAKKLLDLKEKL